MNVGPDSGFGSSTLVIYPEKFVIVFRKAFKIPRLENWTLSPTPAFLR